MAKKKSRMPHRNKTSNTTLYVFVVVVLFAMACLNGRFAQLEQGYFADVDADFQVHVIDVGQADSILVIADGEAMLIDAAETGEAGIIRSYLKNCGITKLRYAAATHMHNDHIGGFPGVLSEIPAETVLEPVYADSLVPTTAIYERYLDAVDACGAKLHAAKAGETFTLGGAEITVLGPVSENAKNLNDTSLVLRVEYGNAACIFTGDMETPEEKELLQSGADLNADFLKVGHHGADTSSGRSFLSAVSPQYAAISCGKDNDYGHPSQKVLDRLAEFTQDVYITAEQGSVVFSYDKETDTCKLITERNAE